MLEIPISLHQYNTMNTDTTKSTTNLPLTWAAAIHRV